MKTLFKKFALGIVMMLVLCGTVFGQTPKKNQVNKEKKVVGSIGLSYNTRTINEMKAHTFYLHAVELGPRFGQSPFFITLGLGVDFTYIDLNKSYIYSWNLHVPAYLGAVFGKSDKMHFAIRGGIMYNCLLQQFKGENETNINGEVEWQLDNRSSWAGTFRATFGYDIYCLFVQYDLPFGNDKKTNTDGIWRFGISFGL